MCVKRVTKLRNHSHPTKSAAIPLSIISVDDMGTESSPSKQPRSVPSHQHQVLPTPIDTTPHWPDPPPLLHCVGSGLVGISSTSYSKSPSQFLPDFSILSSVNTHMYTYTCTHVHKYPLCEHTYAHTFVCKNTHPHMSTHMCTHSFHAILGPLSYLDSPLQASSFPAACLKKASSLWADQRPLGRCQ